MDIKQYTQNIVKNINKQLKEKQNALQFDNEPTENSDNPVTSDGVKRYVDTHSGGVDITPQEIADYFDICNVQASVEEEDDELVLELENTDIDHEDGEPVLIFNTDNVGVENKILEIEE